MKKNLLMILAVSVISCAYAQNKNKYAIKDLSKAVYKNPNAIERVDIPFFPLKPVNYVSSGKAVTSKVIGTSGNIYMCLDDGVRWLSYNDELNVISFSHRLGGTGGGTSGQLRVKYSTDLFTTKDSVFFNPTSPNLFRYPSNGIYNPAGNTDLTKAYSVIAGPCTNGSGWPNNFFGSQRIDNVATNSVHYEAIPPDSLYLAVSGFACGNGRTHATMPVSLEPGANPSDARTLYFRVFNGLFNPATEVFDYSSNFIKSSSDVIGLFRIRKFSSGAVTGTWAASENLAFENNGLHGFFSVLGKDSTDNPLFGAMPIIWETNDGGETWNKELYQNFGQIPELRKYIYPTYASLGIPDSSQWEYRPEIFAGSTVDENNSPTLIDGNGNLHIVGLVEGAYSSNPDSLDYIYANHPRLLFDLIRKPSGCWSAVFIDTLRTGIVEAVNSGFGTGTDAQGWGHWYRISKSPDGNKVFYTWTDTDPQIDTTNIMPDIFGKGIDLVSGMATPIVPFTAGDGFYYYMQAAEKVIHENTTYKIPVTYVNIYESGPDPLSAQKHYYLDGIQFDEADFTIPVEFNCPPVSSGNMVHNLENVSQAYPNPANGATAFNVTVKENSDINVSITNMLGQTIYKTVKTKAGVGTHTFSMDTKTWGNGVYFYTVTLGGNKVTKKLVVE